MAWLVTMHRCRRVAKYNPQGCENDTSTNPRRGNQPLVVAVLALAQHPQADARALPNAGHTTVVMPVTREPANITHPAVSPADDHGSLAAETAHDGRTWLSIFPPLWRNVLPPRHLHRTQPLTIISPPECGSEDS